MGVDPREGVEGGSREGGGGWRCKQGGEEADGIFRVVRKVEGRREQGVGVVFMAKGREGAGRYLLRWKLRFYLP